MSNRTNPLLCIDVYYELYQEVDIRLGGGGHPQTTLFVKKLKLIVIFGKFKFEIDHEFQSEAPGHPFFLKAHLRVSDRPVGLSPLKEIKCYSHFPALIFLIHFR
jgi:hypothetical protein